MHSQILKLKTMLVLTIVSLLLPSLPTHAVPVTLDANGTSFGAELLTGSSDIGVIFYHGRGQNPSGDVVRHLQTSLNNRGYTTLSLENPVPVGGTSYANYAAQEGYIDDQVFARLNAALTEMANNNVQHVVLSGFSLGSRFMTASAAAWNAGIFTPGVNIDLLGLVGVGMYGSLGGSAPTAANPMTLDDFNVLHTHSNLAFIDAIPVLDLFGSNDLQAVANAGIRSGAYGGGPGMYVQTQLTCPPNNGTYYARVNGNFVPYYGADGTDDRRCHQMRNGWLPDGNGGFVESHIMRNSDATPLEQTVSDFFDNHIQPRVAVTETSPLLLMLLGLPLMLVARSKTAS